MNINFKVTNSRYSLKGSSRRPDWNSKLNVGANNSGALVLSELRTDQKSPDKEEKEKKETSTIPAVLNVNYTVLELNFTYLRSDRPRTDRVPLHDARTSLSVSVGVSESLSLSK